MTTATLGYQVLSLDPVHLDRVAALHDPPLTREEATAVLHRFWSYVQKSDGDGCWPWIGGRIKHGYGRASIGRRRTMLASRLSYAIQVGPLEGDECALHACDNPPCIRTGPGHLFRGDRGVNARDMATKGRQHVQRNPRARPHCPAERKARGERNGNSRLTRTQVIEIRERFAGGARKTDLARDYGSRISHISAIVTGTLWKDAGGPIAQEVAA